MSSRIFSQSCPFEGCDYVSKATSSSAAEHNLGSHISNYHKERTKVWYGSTQVTIYRDTHTKKMSCPCGKLTSVNASSVRNHAATFHKGNTNGHSDIGTNVAATSSTARSIPSTPVPSASMSVASKRAAPHHEPSREEVRSSSKGKGSAAAAVAAAIGQSAFIVNSHQLPDPMILSKSTLTSVAKRARDVFEAGNAESSEGMPAQKMRRKDAGSSSHRGPLAEQFTPITRPSSKARPADTEQPVSSWISKLTSYLEHQSASRDKAARPVVSTAATFSNPRVPSIPQKHAREEGEPSASRTSHRDRADTHSVPKSKHKSAKPSPFVAVPRRSPAVASSSTFTAASDSSGSASRAKAATKPLTRPSVTRIGNFEIEEVDMDAVGDVDMYGHAQEEVRALKSAKSSAKTAPPTNATTSAAPPAPAPAPAPRPKPKPRPLYLAKARAAAAAAAIDIPKLPAAFPDTTSARRAVVEPPSPAPVLAPSSEANAMDVDPPGASDSESESETKRTDVPAKPRQRRPRVSKKMRARAFRRWFDAFLAEYRAGKNAGAAAAVDKVKDPSAVHELGEGRTYTTAEEFFDVLEACLREYRAGLERGGKEVLQFAGDYAIVAQPKIGHKAREEKVRVKLREIGMPIDEERQYSRATSMSGSKLTEIEESWLYPCGCGGTYNPKPSPFPLSGPPGSCKGTIMLTIGDNNALAACGIKGQRIRITVMH